MILHEQVLKLGHGAIGVIEDGAFIGLVRLKELSLTNCKLKEMPPLSPVKDSMETLELRRNSLSSTSNDYFNDFHKLHTIDLGNNSLEVAPNVSALNDQLKTLKIPFNKIITLDSLTSAVYPQLFRLDVAGNRLTQLTRSMFSYWPALRYFYLEDNSLKTIENLSPLAHGVPLKVRMINRVA